MTEQVDTAQDDPHRRHQPQRRRGVQGEEPARAGGSRRPRSCASPCSPAAAPACATSSSSTSGNLDGDVVTDFDGVSVVVDRMSVPYLNGATIDFVDTIEKQGFTIDNPNADRLLRLRRLVPLSEDASADSLMVVERALD